MADYTGNNTILAGRTVSTGTYGKTSGSTAVSSHEVALQEAV